MVIIREGYEKDKYAEEKDKYESECEFGCASAAREGDAHVHARTSVCSHRIDDGSDGMPVSDRIRSRCTRAETIREAAPR